MFNSGNFDAKRLLDQFLTPQAGGQGQAGGNVPAPQNPLGSLLGGLAGNVTGGVKGAPGSQPSGSGDLVGKAKEYLGNNGGSLASGAAAGALVSLVMGKGGKKLATNAVALGGLALVGTLAYKAYQNYQQGQQPQQAATPLPPQQAQLPPAHSPFHPAQADHGHFPVTLLRTMIAASLADGHIDETERAAITGKLNQQGAQLDEAERFLTGELANPASPDSLAREVSTPEEAAEVYITALLAIDADNTAERAFLARLAMALKLDPNLTPHLEAAARAAKQG